MRRYASHITLVAVLSAVSCARMFVATKLRAWGLPALIDTAGLLTSELVTNAVKATGTLEAVWKPHDLSVLNMLIVRIESRGGGVAVSVWDCDAALPTVAPFDLDAEDGRGLRLVEAMSARWGCYPSPKGGKVVWFELAPPPPKTALGLPIRGRPACSSRPAAGVIRDRAMLLRIRDALLAL